MAQKRCSKCGVEFTCCNEQRGCWCETLTLEPAVLKELKKNYDNCLCPDCLGGYSKKAELKT